ncbi:hypothetical protein HDU93_002016, partial [Gonapodya sp. JEL0774]
MAVSAAADGDGAVGKEDQFIIHVESAEVMATLQNTLFFGITFLSVLEFLLGRLKEWHYQTMFRSPLILVDILSSYLPIKVPPGADKVSVVDTLAELIVSPPGPGILLKKGAYRVASKLDLLLAAAASSAKERDRMSVDWKFKKTVRVVKLHFERITPRKIRKSMRKFCTVEGNGMKITPPDSYLRYTDTMDIRTLASGVRYTIRNQDDKYVKIMYSEPPHGEDDNTVVRAEFYDLGTGLLFGSVMYGVFTPSQLDTYLMVAEMTCRDRPRNAIKSTPSRRYTPDGGINGVGKHRLQGNRKKNITYALKSDMPLAAKRFSDQVSTRLGVNLFNEFAEHVFPKEATRSFVEHRKDAKLSFEELISTLFVGFNYQAEMHVDRNDKSLYSFGFVAERIPPELIAKTGTRPIQGG